MSEVSGIVVKDGMANESFESLNHGVRSSLSYDFKVNLPCNYAYEYGQVHFLKDALTLITAFNLEVLTEVEP